MAAHLGKTSDFFTDFKELCAEKMLRYIQNVMTSMLDRAFPSLDCILGHESVRSMRHKAAEISMVKKAEYRTAA